MWNNMKTIHWPSVKLTVHFIHTIITYITYITSVNAMHQPISRWWYNDKYILHIFYPHLIYGIEFYGHAAKCHLNQILISQKAAVCRIMKIRPPCHASSNFKTLQIIPIDMLFKYRFLLLFENRFSRVSLQLNRPTYNQTRSKDQIVPNNNWQQQQLRGKLTVDHRCQPVEYIPAGGGARWACESERTTGVCTVGVLCIAAAG